MIRAVSLMMAVALLLTLVAGIGAANPDDLDPNEDLDGNGTASDPYIITDASALQAMEGNLTAHYRLGNDVDASGTANWNDGEGFDPIGSDLPFTGSFDGDGHTISNLYINRPEAEDGGEPDDAALFIAIDGATIAAVELSGATISPSNAGEAGDNNRASDGGAAAGFVIDISNAAVTGVSVHDSTITAGDGGARGVGISGGNGGFAAGFAVESDGTEVTGVTVSESTIIAGAGGLGGSSAFGNDGGDGGDGGYAAGLIAVNTGGTIEAASVTDVIVETADGGDGGDGGDNENGDGGDGGNGGDGGYAAGLIVENHGGDVLNSDVDFDVITAGDGGNAGAAGSDGGISHSIPGDGGNGGAGGHAAGLIAVNTDATVDGATVSGHSNSRITAGNGGDGGLAANVDGGDNDGGDGGDGGDAAGLIAVNTGGAVSESSVETVNSEAGDGGDGNESGPAADNGGHGGAGGNAAGLIATNVDGEVSASSVSGADSYGGAGGDGGSADNYAGDGGDAGSVGGLIGVHFGGSVTDSSVSSDSLYSWESPDVISFNGGNGGDGHDRTTIGGDGGDGGAGGSAGGLVGVNEGTVTNSIVDGLNIESGYGSDGGAAGEGTTNDDGTEGIAGEDGPRGGLVGTNSGTVTGSTVMNTDLISKYAGWDDDSVDSDGYGGGLVGVNTGTVEASAGFNLWVENEFGSAAGLVGKNEGILRESYIAGNSGVAVNEGDAAGAVGVNHGTVDNTYVTDTGVEVWIAGSVAGFVSTNDGTVSKAYVGDVEFWVEEGAQAAGFAGTNTDSISASYWDTDATDESVGVRSGGGAVTGLSTVDMTGGEALNAGNMGELGSAWETVDTNDWDTSGDGYPILASLARIAQLESQGLDNVVTITGTVSEGGSGEPIEGAEVSVTGTSLSELTVDDVTADDGTYDLTVADEETYELTASATVGGVEISNTTTVETDGAATADLSLYPELDGDGTEEAPYEISTALELQTVQQNLDANYVLVDDVDAAETADWNGGDGFDPIDGFKGTFDGDGYEIQGLTIDRSEASSGNRGDAAALFGTIEGATITSLGIVDATISAGDGASGADGVHDPEDGERGGDAAGLVLESIDGVVAYSYVVDSTISAGAGGDGGDGHSGTGVGSDAGHGGHAAGIVLENGGDVIASYVLNSSVIARSGGDGGSSGAVSGEEGTAGDGGNAGAIVVVNTGDITQSYSSVSSIDAGSAGSGSDGEPGVLGGIAGINDGTLVDSYFRFGATSLGETNGVGEGPADGVTARTTAEMQRFAPLVTMDGFDFAETWNITDAYPRLVWEEIAEPTVDAIDASNGSVTAGGPSEINVSVLSGDSNAGEGVTVEVLDNGGLGGVSVGDTEITGSHSNATFTVDETVAGTYELEFAWADNHTIADTVTITVEPATVDSVVISPHEAQLIEAGEEIEFSATAFDTYDNLVEDDNSAFTWVDATSDGTFTNTTAGTYAVTAELDSTTSATVSVTVEQAAGDSIELTPDTDQTVRAGDEVTFNATLTDEFGNVVEDRDSEFTWTNTTDDGTFSNTAVGTYIVTATFDSITSSDVSVTVTPAAVNSVEIDPHLDQTITAGETLGFNATAVDEFGNVNETSASAFTWSNTTTEGRFERTTAGTYDVSATLNGVSTATTVTVVSAEADILTVESQPDALQRAGEDLTGSPTVLVTDAFDNPVAGKEISATLNGSTTLFGTTRVETNEFGIAVFDSLSVETADSYTLEFENAAAGITAASEPFIVEPSEPAALSIETQPVDTAANESIAGPPTVAVTDEFDNPVVDENVTVNLNSSTEIQGMTAVKTDGAGHAVFDSLRISTIGEYTLDFALVDNVSINATAEPFEITPADAGSVTVDTQPTSTPAGEVLIGPPSVTVTDAFGNPLADTTVDVRTNETKALFGPLAVDTNTAGVAEFDSLQINATGSYTLTFEANGGVNVTSDIFEITPIAPTTLNAANSSTTAGTTGTITVMVTDEFNNTVEGITLNVTDSDGLGNLSETAVTNNGGLAAFTFNESVRGTYTPTFAVESDSAVIGTVTVTVDSSAPETAAVTANANSHTVSDDFTDNNALVATVTLLDGFDNPVSNAVVNVADNGTDVQVRDGRQQLTDESGAVTFEIQSKTAQEDVRISFTEQESGQNNSAVLDGISFEPAGPQASGSASSYTVSTGTNVTLRAGSSTVPEGSNPQYEWEFDDGTTTRTATGITNTTSFDAPGTITVTLTVTVADETATDSFRVTVEDRRRPNARLTTPTTVGVNQPFSLDATESTDNVAIAEYQWDFGNGTVINGSALDETTGNYSVPGEYDVVLTVTDTSGNTDTNMTTIMLEGADATLATDPLDFGEVGTSSAATESISISNNGMTALNVTESTITGDNVSGFRVTGDDEPRVRPGEDRSLTVFFEPTTVGKQNATLTITTENNTGSNHFEIDLSGVGIESNLTAATSTTHFGNVDIGTSADQKVTLGNDGTNDAIIETVEFLGSDASQFSIVDGPSTINPSETANITVSFDPQAVGSQSATLRIETTDGDSTRIAFGGTGEGPQLSVPSTARSAGSIGSGTNTTVSAELRNYGTQPLVITNLTLTGDTEAFEIETGADGLVIAPDSSETVDLTFEPEQPDEYVSTLEVVHNDTTTDTAEITFSGTAVAADINVDQRTADFGTTAVGQPEFLNITIQNQNNAGALLTIDGTSIVGSNAEDFSVEGPEMPFTIEAGEERNLQLNFTAQEAGEREAQLQINSDANQGQTNVWLSNTRSYILVQEVSNPTVNILADNLNDGSTRVLNVSTPSTRGSNVTVDELGFTMQREGNFEMELVNSESAFANAFDGDDDTEIVQYVGIDHIDHLANETFSDTALVYRVDSAALPVDATSEDVEIHRFDEATGEYVTLAAEFHKESGGQYHYHVETPGFSEFAITVDTSDDPSPGPSPSPSPGSGPSSGSGPSAPALDPTGPTVTGEPSESGGLLVTISGQQAGDQITVDGASAGTGNLLSGVETIQVDSLDIGLNTDREVRFDVSTYESDLTPSYGHETSVELSDRLQSASAAFEFETSTLSAGYVHIDHDLVDEEVDDIAFAFSIRQAYLDEIGVDPKEVTLYRQESAGWNALPTDQIGSTDSHVRFESSSPGLSVFALGTGAPPVGVTEATLRDDLIETGETATVDVTVENRGQHRAEHTLELTADGEIVATENVSLEAGQTAETTLSFDPVEGKYAMAVDGTEAGTLTVGDGEPNPSWLWLLIGLGVLTVAVLWRRSQNAENEKQVQ